MQKNIYTATFGLIFRQSIGESRVHQSEFRATEVTAGASTFNQPSSFVMTQEPLISLPEAAIVGIAPIGRQAFGISVLSKKIPDIGPWIGNTIANGFCRINNTSTTDSQNEIHRFFLTE